MNVLSLFDGMSGGQLALKRAGIKVDEYYASEIDKHAIKVTMSNFPNTKQLGSVVSVRGFNLPKIDLLIGGSPCQGFSFAGKGLNFEDPRSKLFFEYVRVLQEVRAINPDVKFLLENVNMKKEHQDIITKYLGVPPIKINSALVSAQNRVRLYWTNIPNVSPPNDKGILLKDVIENGVVDREKAYCIDACYYKGGNIKQYFNKARRQIVFKDGEALAFAVRQVGRRIKDGKRADGDKKVPLIQRLEVGEQKSNCLSTVEKDSLVLVIPEATKKGYVEIENEECFDGSFPTSTTRRGRKMKDKSNCLTASGNEFMQFKDGYIRKLTPVECERLQTVPDNYTNFVSTSQRYKILGNGWTVDVIAGIFKNLKDVQ